MEIYDVLKIMASENKAKIIAKFLYCSNCHKETVNKVCDQTGLKQPNLSKHLMELKQKGVIIDEKSGREVFYKINQKFQDKWGKLLAQIVQANKDLEKHHCGCCR